VFFQTLKRFLTSFSILFNFQGPVRLSLAADDLFILPPKWFFVKPYFLEAFELSELGHPRSFSEQTGTFQRLLVLFKGFLLRLRKSFFCLSAWRSSIIPHPPPPCQHFLTDFFQFLCSIKALPVFHPFQDVPFFLTRQCTERIMESSPYPVLYSYTYSIREKRHVLCQHPRRARYSGALLYYIYIILRCRGGLCL